MDAFADDKRVWPQQISSTSLKLFFITLIELHGLERMLTAGNESELGIAIVLMANTICLFFNQRKTEFWPVLAV